MTSISPAPAAAGTSVWVHAPTCPAARASVTRNTANVHATWPRARAHSCMPGGFSGPTVRLVTEQYPLHNYAPSMSWPAGTSRALCRVCDGAHDD